MKTAISCPSLYRSQTPPAVVLRERGKLLKILALAAPMAVMSPVFGASVSWTAQAVADNNLSAPADQSGVATAGTLVDAINVAGSAITVNTVPFAAGPGAASSPNSDWSEANVTWGNTYGSFYTTSGSGSPANASDAWLSTGKYGNNAGSVGTLHLNNLTVGHQYAVQLFFADIRPGSNGNKMKVDGGPAYQYAFNSGGSYGYLIMNGAFVANATIQTITMHGTSSAGADGNTQINAYQFRDLGVPTVVFTPTFSMPAGTYVGAQTVTISSATPGATIYYTTDGSTPTNASASGASGLTVNLPIGTTVINAYGHLDGDTDSSMASATYNVQAPSSSVWTNPAGGSWTTASNWQGSVIPIGDTADFSTLDLSADTTVTLDGARTMAHLAFGDTTASNDWILNTGSGDPLTMASTSGNPSIAVNNRTATLGLVLAGTQGFDKSGAGTLVLTGANTYTGTTAVNGGTLKLTDLADHRSSVTVATGAVCEVNVATNVNAANSFTITGAGTLVKTGAGSWLIGAGGRVGIGMSAGGLVDIQGGILGNGNHQNSWTGNQASVNIASGATLDIAAENVPVDSLTGSGSATNSYPPSGARTLAVGVANGSGTFGGVISSSVLFLNKSGTGTQVLTGNNTYTAGTSITGGILQIDGDQTAATGGLTVASGGTLSGHGILGGGTSVSSGGTISPGPAIATLTTKSNVTFASGSTFAADINTDSTSADQLAVTGNISLGNATLSLANLGTATPTIGTKYTIATYTGTLSGTFSGLADGASVSVGSIPFIIRYADGNAITLQVVSSVPYDAWATAKGLDSTNNGPNQDPDHDGISNLLEFYLGGNPLASSNAVLPAIMPDDTFLIVTFQRLTAAQSDVTTQVIQYGSDLAGWTDFPLLAEGSSDDNGAFSQVFTNGSMDSVTVWIPKSLASDGKLFARLKVSR